MHSGRRMRRTMKAPTWLAGGVACALGSMALGWAAWSLVGGAGLNVAGPLVLGLGLVAAGVRLLGNGRRG